MIVPLDDRVPGWWANLDADQQSRLKQAAQSRRLNADGRRLLQETDCPMTPTAIGDGLNGENAFDWPDSLLQFVLSAS